MSYQVLARKWRPQQFADLLGQEHVVKALTNALDNDRLHHAYLFTGMRGVGKTTIARIFAKSLNCEKGVSSKPCGRCTTCQDIENGRFFDLIEVDAASKTGVDATRELMENATYAPTSGRFKVFLIDEVHMFSTAAFNALLKTLEEPPAHTKFILATTEHHKIPVTVLSRCLQFSLKGMAERKLAAYLGRILDTENIDYDQAALSHIAYASEGSVRDSLSLIEQATAIGGGALLAEEVESMLGRLSPARVLDVLDAIASNDGELAMQTVAQLAEYGPDYKQLLGELISVLHHIAMAKTVPGSERYLSSFDVERLQQLVQSISDEDVQLYHQIAVHGRRDMGYSPDQREAFEMTLLRMLTFTIGTSFADPNQQNAPPPTSLKSPPGNSAHPESAAASALTSGQQPARNMPDTGAPASEAATGNSRVVESRALHEHSSTSDQSEAQTHHAVVVGQSASSAVAPPTVDSGGLTGPAAMRAALEQPAETLVVSPAAKIPGRKQSQPVAALQPAKPAGVGADRSQQLAKIPATHSGPAPVPPSAEPIMSQMQQPLARSQSVAEGSVASQVADSLNVVAAAPETATPAEQSHTSSPVPFPEPSSDHSAAATGSHALPVPEQVDRQQCNATQEPVSSFPIDLTWNQQSWGEILGFLNLKGLPGQLARNCCFVELEEHQLKLITARDSDHLISQRAIDAISAAVSRVLNRDVKSEVVVGDLPVATPAQTDRRMEEEKQLAAERSIETDPLVQTLLARVDGVVEPNSIQPLETET